MNFNGALGAGLPDVALRCRLVDVVPEFGVASGRANWDHGGWERLLAQRVGFVVVPPVDLPMREVVSPN